MAPEEMIYEYFSFFNDMVAMTTSQLCNLHTFPVVDRGLLQEHFCKGFVQMSTVT